MGTNTDEQAAFDDLARRLSERYPNINAEVVKAAVITAADGFAGAHVRDFIPVLVERRVRQDLRTLAAS